MAAARPQRHVGPVRLEYTYQLVPAGQELDGLDWDAVTASLLEDLEVHSG
ncbi:hypothetical protein ABT124_47705 [Streptomyces sp. NPDC001982]